MLGYPKKGHDRGFIRPPERRLRLVQPRGEGPASADPGGMSSASSDLGGSGPAPSNPGVQALTRSTPRRGLRLARPRECELGLRQGARAAARAHTVPNHHRRKMWAWDHAPNVREGTDAPQHDQQL
jgi:hypothetical protein